jgi:3-oxoacyl-[acyl-carrier-protein] synthase II
MFTDTNRTDVVVTGLGPVCRAACGHAALAAIDESRLFAAAPSGEWFDAPRWLGPRGYKYLPPATRYMLAAAGLALAHADIREGTYTEEQRGVMVGSNFAVSAVHDAMDRTILDNGADALSPMEAANFSINLAASYVSLKYGCKGFNVCFTSAMVAGLEALVFGANALGRGRAALLVAGATEGAPPHAIGPLVGAAVEDGAACALTLEAAAAARQRGAQIYGTFAGGVLAFAPPRGVQQRGEEDLDPVIAAALDRMTLAAGPLHLYGPGHGCAFNEAVGQVTRRQLRERRVNAADESALAADNSLITVSPLLQIAFALSRRQNCLIVSASPLGHIAMVAFTADAGRVNRAAHSPQQEG